MPNPNFENSDTKQKYPTLEDMMFNNKSAQKISKKKKAAKRFNDYKKSLKNNAE